MEEQTLLASLALSSASTPSLTDSLTLCLLMLSLLLLLSPPLSSSCAATLKKAKVAQHSYSCGSYYYSCIDCGDQFDTETIKAHNSCISEAEKHQ